MAKFIKALIAALMLFFSAISPFSEPTDYTTSEYSVPESRNEKTAETKSDANSINKANLVTTYTPSTAINQKWVKKMSTPAPVKKHNDPIVTVDDWDTMVVANADDYAIKIKLYRTESALYKRMKNSRVKFKSKEEIKRINDRLKTESVSNPIPKPEVEEKKPTHTFGLNNPRVTKK